MSKDRIRAESAGRTGVHWRSTLAVAPILLVALGHFVSRPVSTDEVVNGVHIQVTRYEALAGCATSGRSRLGLPDLVGHRLLVAGGKAR
ncbi:MAG: hypothetical protein R3E96_15165 [Planctomycetota bacterium]